MLSVVYAVTYAQCRIKAPYAECRYPECRYGVSWCLVEGTTTFSKRTFCRIAFNRTTA